MEAVVYGGQSIGMWERAKDFWERNIGIDPRVCFSVEQQIADVAAQACPFTPGRSIGKTHRLVIIPEGLTIEQMIAHARNPREGNGWDREGGGTIFQELQNVYGNSPVSRSYAFFILKNQITLEVWQQYTGLLHTEPSLIEITTAVAMRYIRDGKQVFHSEEDPTRDFYTLCEEKVKVIDIYQGEVVERVVPTVATRGLNENDGILLAPYSPQPDMPETYGVMPVRRVEMSFVALSA